MFDICVLLGGCGMYDGSDPQETILLAAALARREGRPTFVAPDVDQLHVVDHLNGDAMDGSRRVLQEAARLARGKVTALEEFRPAQTDALVIPGGHGVAKNLMTGFATPGARPEVRPEVKALLSHCLESGKPLAVVSLAKLLLEMVVPSAFTERLRSEAADQVYVDEEHRLLYTPGFLVGDRLEQILPGIEALAERLIGMCEEAPE
jgi:enhancing lycopene biosynthesis protein 2